MYGHTKARGCFPVLANVDSCRQVRPSAIAFRRRLRPRKLWNLLHPPGASPPEASCVIVWAQSRGRMLWYTEVLVVWVNVFGSVLRVCSPEAQTVRRNIASRPTEGFGLRIPTDQEFKCKYSWHGVDPISSMKGRRCCDAGERSFERGVHAKCAARLRRAPAQLVHILEKIENWPLVPVTMYIACTWYQVKVETWEENRCQGSPPYEVDHFTHVRRIRLVASFPELVARRMPPVFMLKLSWTCNMHFIRNSRKSRLHVGRHSPAALMSVGSRQTTDKQLWPKSNTNTLSRRRQVRSAFLKIVYQAPYVDSTGFLLYAAYLRYKISTK